MNLFRELLLRLHVWYTLKSLVAHLWQLCDVHDWLARLWLRKETTLVQQLPQVSVRFSSLVYMHCLLAGGPIVKRRSANQRPSQHLLVQWGGRSQRQNRLGGRVVWWRVLSAHLPHSHHRRHPSSKQLLYAWVSAQITTSARLLEVFRLNQCTQILMKYFLIEAITWVGSESKAGSCHLEALASSSLSLSSILDNVSLDKCPEWMRVTMRRRFKLSSGLKWEWKW